MRITVERRGVRAIKDRLAALSAARNVVGEVYWEGERNVMLGHIHAEGAPSNKLPARNPFFVQPGDARRVQGIFRRGVNEIMAGRSTDFTPAMAEAAQVVATGMQRNIAPPGRLNAKTAGLHAPAGTAVSTGTKMQRLSQPYGKQKDRTVGPKPILVRTGELWASIKARVVGA